MVARLLLAAGGALVVIAAAVFTVANWGDIGAAGRGAVLLAVTALALAVPSPLARRGLTATAESVAAIGLALTLADADLGWRLVTNAPGVGLGSASLACAALAVAWAAYGTLAPVRGPRLAAIGLAQFPLPLAAAATVSGSGPVAFALALTAAGDLLLTAWAGRAQLAAERLAGCLAAAATWIGAVVTATSGIGAAMSAAGGAAAASADGMRWSAVVFVLAGAVGVLGARMRWMPGELAGLITGSCGGLVAAGLALLVTPGLPGGWRVAAYAVSGAVIASAVWWARPLTRPASVTEQAAGDGERAKEKAARDASGTAGDATGPAGDASGPVEGSGSAPAGTAVRSLAGYLAAGGAAVLGVAGLLVAPGGVTALWYPLAWVSQAWAVPAVTARAGMAPWVVWHGWPATPAVLALAGLACWLGPAARERAVRAAVRSKVWPVAVAVTALAVGSVPVVVGMPGWAALLTLTALAAALLGTGSVLDDRAVAGTAAAVGLLVAVSAALWSLTGPAVTLAELAILVVICGAAAAVARSWLPAALATIGILAAAGGVACAAALASGLPARYAAFAVAGVAGAAVGAAWLVRGSRPAPALVLELGAVPVVLAALAMSSQRTGTTSALAALVALLSAIAAWLWRGPRRAIALAATAVMAVSALAAQVRILVPAAFAPYQHFAGPWRGIPPAHGTVAGLPFAVVVLAVCAAAAVIAAGAWQGRRGSLDALAVVLPLVAAPAVVAGGLDYAITVGVLLALAVGLIVGAAVTSSVAWAIVALAAVSLVLAWALAAPLPTLVVLGCVAAAAAGCAWRAPLAVVRAAAAGVSVLSLCALGACAALAAGLPAWQAGLAALAAVAAAQSAAAWLARPRPELSLAAEVAGWAAAVAAIVPGLDTPAHASVMLLVTGTLCLWVALRPGRRVFVWLGLAQGEAALCAWLASAGVYAPEPYTVPAAAVLIAAGWWRSRRSPQVSSWITYGPGLALLLLPSLAAVWLLAGWVRPLVLGLAAAGIALAGGRARLLAPLLLGGTVAILDAGHELAPEVWRLAGVVPRWVPIAVIGVILLAVGATYEARLRDLGRLRAALGRMH